MAHVVVRVARVGLAGLVGVAGLSGVVGLAGLVGVVGLAGLSASCKPHAGGQAIAAAHSEEDSGEAPGRQDPTGLRPTASALRPADPEPPASARVGTAGPQLAASPDDLAGPGFPEAGPWVSSYGTAAQMGDLAKVARTFRIINVDADPGAGNFTDAQLAALKAGGRSRVLSYMNVGACERYRSYWKTAPAGLVSCEANKAAQRGKYVGYDDETWMDVGDPDYQRLVLEHVAPRLAQRGVDGFYLDNLEILEHSSMSTNGPCDSACKQGGLDLVRKLREKYPRMLIVMQNATSDVTRLGTTGGVPFRTLLDGIAHEEVYAPRYDETAEKELVAWRAMKLRTPSGRPLWIGVEDYVGSCVDRPAAHAALARAREKGFSSYVSDESGAQKTVCWWD